MITLGLVLFASLAFTYKTKGAKEARNFAVFCGVLLLIVLIMSLENTFIWGITD